ncbi:MAG: OadG family protein [Bacteroidales bacterium]|jgi:Na+-transporting methylmalonyl-CoA/oxaloacetate decarboxylase gamma subunit|nr:OadG family protein [Bacteroidales bacterium]
MKSYFKFIILAGALLISPYLFAQSAIDIRINEVLTSNKVDTTNVGGDNSGWVELYNSAYGLVDVAGFFITDQEIKENGPKPAHIFMIPKGNVSTQIPYRQFFMLYADGDTTKGPFHMNFTLDNVKKLYIYAPDRKQLVDVITIPQLPAGKSYGRIHDGEGLHMPYAWNQASIRKTSVDKKIPSNGGLEILKYPTPGTTNSTDPVVSKSQKMWKMDPDGWILSVTAMSVVFLGLIVLYLSFKQVGKNSIKNAKKKEAAAKGIAAPEKGKKIDETDVPSAEVFAAIAMACHLYMQESEIHDEESNIVTIQNESRRYSPWGEKVYLLKQTPTVRRS